jgi:hypothetical protein
MCYLIFLRIVVGGRGQEAFTLTHLTWEKTIAVIAGVTERLRTFTGTVMLKRQLWYSR